MSGATQPEKRIVYCHCAYAKVVPVDVKEAVLAGLAESGVAFDAVPDLCELAARQDPALKRLATTESPVDVVACYPRAVKWLFHAAEAPLPEDGVNVHNMRTASAEDTLAAVLSGETDQGERAPEASA